jgi:hypothetical protein
MDVYVYHFMRIGPTGGNILSKRWATLDAIKGKGEAVMESQLVVDHTEVDAHGFVVGNGDVESHPMDALWALIRSLELRAQSRDDEAIQLNEGSEAETKYMLSLESRELRKQAQALRRQRTDSMVGELGNQIDSRVFPQFGGPTISY